jgi:tetratricopeptide (TPR) repeat protein
MRPDMQTDLARLQRSPRDAALWRQAQEQLLGGQHGPALVEYKKLTRRFPGVAELWFELGNAALGELNFELADQSYRRARDLASANAPLLGMLGHQYQGLRQLDAARQCYERAVKAKPDSVDAHINLAVWFEKERRLDDAWEIIEGCRLKWPQDDQVRYFRALLLHRKKRSSEAETALRDLIQDGPQYPYVKYASRHLLGVVLDELGQYAEALRWLGEAKALVRQLTDVALLEQGYDRADRKRRELLAAMTPEVIQRWRQETPVAEPGPRIAFLGGHPRSGTTLLEQILDAHPDVLAFDEPVAFGQEISRNISPPPGSGEAQVRALDAVPTDRRQQLRQQYVKSLLREIPGPLTAQILLDKNPSPTMSLPLWLRIFPELKVIIALRDPRDVLISCYFLNIMLNETNANFLSLERTAKHYADLMDVWLRMRELGGFDWIESRYEDVVENLEPEGRKITEFLGLSWHADQARYHETARRKFLFAPTYHDVTQPVYRKAMGRWHHYAEALEPLQARLAPYCRAFGYSM